MEVPRVPTLAVNCRNVAAPAMQNVAGGNIALDVGGNLFSIQSDSGSLVFNDTNQYVGGLMTNQMFLPINSAGGNVFFRLVFP